MTDPARHDWQRLIAEIEAGYFAYHGKRLSNYRLGRLAEMDANGMKRLKETAHAQPRHYEGVLLLKLHAQYAGQSCTK